LEKAEVVVGYKTYLDLIEDLLTGKELVIFGMKQEIKRCAAALELARKGRRVALVSGGDPGVYGMAGPLLEMAVRKGEKVGIRVIPGVTAATAAAAELGAPLAHDFAVISLSDLLTPWSTIAHRLEAAAAGDFVTVLYNPKSRHRGWQIREARKIFLCYRCPGTPVGIVRNARRCHGEVVVSTLGDFLEVPMDMATTVIIGSSTTYRYGDWMITPRGYPVGANEGGSVPFSCPRPPLLHGKPAPGRAEKEHFSNPGLSRKDEALKPDLAGTDDARPRGMAKATQRAVVVMAGTREAHETITVLARNGYRVVATVVTSFGRNLAEAAGADEVVVRAMTARDLAGLLDREKALALVDATHPFAVEATCTAREACHAAGVPYLRYERPGIVDKGDGRSLACGRAGNHGRRDTGRQADELTTPFQVAAHYAEAAEMAVRAGSVIFLTTGSHSLEVFVRAARVAGKRIVARVLPDEGVFQKCLNLGLGPADIVAMKGPFSRALNEALFRQYGADVLVTKDSGTAGGLEEKLAAARTLGIPVVVVKRPKPLVDAPDPGGVREASGLHFVTVRSGEEVLQILTRLETGMGHKEEI